MPAGPEDPAGFDEVSAIDQPLAHVDDRLPLVRALRLIGQVALPDRRIRSVPVALEVRRLGVTAGRTPRLARLHRRRAVLGVAERHRRSERAVPVALLLR